MQRLYVYWLDIRSSLWFIPGVLTLAAVALALLLIEVDLILGNSLERAFPLMFGAGADGARGMLATIAGSIITVAGVAFSITVLALSQTASQYSSRVLRNFMRDLTSQTTLGVLVGVFAYCLVVLRTIRGGSEGAFVPYLAVLGGVVLAFVSIGFFIFFIHHIASAIQASHIIATVARETFKSVDDLFPEELGEEPPELAPRPELTDWRPVFARSNGYIQRLDADSLLELASELDVVIRMERCIGEFVVEQTPLASLSGAGKLDEAVLQRLHDAFTINSYRTPDQDAAFGLRQLVDVAMKALSPGVNDTTTAVMCVDYLSAVLAKLARRHIPSGSRWHEGKLRILARGRTFEDLLAIGFDQIRQNADGNVAVLSRLMAAVETVLALTSSPSRRQALLRHADLILDRARRTIPEEGEREMIELVRSRLPAA